MLNVGDVVTIKVRNPLYHMRDRYANGYVGPEFNDYTGTIMREKWFDANEVGITTGNVNFPFRRIKRENIVAVNEATVDFTPIKTERMTKTVKGSKGDTYVVTKDNGHVSCTCSGYKFRRTCKHIQEFL